MSRNNSLRACLALPLVLFWQSSSCHSKNSNSSNNSPRLSNTNNHDMNESALSGTWGGLHILMEATNDGADVTYDCATGHITAPIVADREGKFSVSGTYVRDHPAATRLGESAANESATYAGQINGETMRLTVTVVESKEIIGTFTLMRGNAGRIRKCI